jgi:AAA domain
MTLGTLATELHHRGRSVLLVSHTNAAVDQALLHVAQAIGEDELERGRVLRLGESKDERILNTPDVLVTTHVGRRSVELVAEREELDIERETQLHRSAAVERLIEIAEWLPNTLGELAQARVGVAEHDQLEQNTAAVAEKYAAAEARLAPWRALEVAARASVEAAAHVELLEEQLLELRTRTATVSAELEQAHALRIEAEVVAEASAQHVPQVRAAQERLAQLRMELPQREPLLAATDRELEDLSVSVTEGETMLTRSVHANALTRRLRGLPRVDDQRQTLESLRRRRVLLEEARTQAAEALNALNVEFQEAEHTIVDYGHLPDPVAAANKAHAFGTDERRLSDDVLRTSTELSEVKRELTRLGAPLQRFRLEHDGQDPYEVLRRLGEFTAALDPIATEFTQLRERLRAARIELDESLVARCRQLRAWSIADELPDSYAALVDVLDRSILAGRAEVGAQSTSMLRAEQEQVLTRVQQIGARLAEIAETLEEMEKVVIAEASVVATTLTRAYKRDSVQARAFDTVILDEASMAPIPALWVVAGRAEKSVVLVGDFMQLPPIKHSTHELAEEWLGRDIFDKAGVRELFGDEARRPAHCVPLREQRRMHPDISAISNRFVYEGTLRDGPAPSDSELLDGWFNHAEPFDYPVLLVDTSTLDAWVSSVNLGGHSSRLNFLSATVCSDVALMMLRDDRESFQPGGTPRILLCAPYRPHATLLSLLAKEQAPVGEVVAGTAHTFQGAEAPVVIFDLVNDEPHWRVGMFSDRMEDDTKRLLNVAFTRAQRRLIIVGDFHWIEQKAKKGGIHRRLIAYLKDHHTTVDARELLPEGFAARAAELQQSGVLARDQPVAPQLVVSQDRFFEHLYSDLARATERVVIYSPFMTYERVGRLEPHLRAAVERGSEMWVITKPLEERSGDRGVYAEIEQSLRNWGMRLVHKKGMHEKLVIIDNEVLWQGSLNPLSFSATQEIMERRASHEIVADYARVLRLDALLAAYRTDETRCPYCGSEVVAAEGPSEPFYWRCVQAGCFTRSIGDMMPVDGRVVCHTCGGQLEFRWPHADPFWRCTENHRHRQPIAGTHLRLPKMREIIPKTELRKLERRFNDRSAVRAQADGRLETG